MLAIPDDTRRFIATSVPSVPFLEALLLYRAAAGEALETRAVAHRLYLSEAAARAIVQDLLAARVIEAVPGRATAHRYAPEPEAAEALERLAALYSTNLIAVTNLIHSRGAGAARKFADAFRWKKDD